MLINIKDNTDAERPFICKKKKCRQCREIATALRSEIRLTIFRGHYIQNMGRFLQYKVRGYLGTATVASTWAPKPRMYRKQGYEGVEVDVEGVAVRAGG